MSESGEERVEKFAFDLFPSHNLSVCLFEDVQNAAEVRKDILAQKFDAAFLDATMVRCHPSDQYLGLLCKAGIP